jgi:hypothetical protein
MNPVIMTQITEDEVPEQISNRLRLEGEESVSAETIYKFIDEDRSQGGYGDTLGAAGFERGAFPLKTGGERYKTPGQYRSDLKGQTADGVLVIGRGI